jgi:hypothetical protein
MITRSLTILTAFAALALMGCGMPDAPAAALEIRSSLVDGEISGRPVADMRLGPLAGRLSGFSLQFISAGGPSSMSLEVCDPAQAQELVDPYASLSGEGGARGVVPGLPCAEQLFVCDEVGTCTGFGDLEIETVALPDGELLVVDAADPQSTVHVEIEYGEL